MSTEARVLSAVGRGLMTAPRIYAALPGIAKGDVDNALWRLYNERKVYLSEHTSPHHMERAGMIHAGGKVFVGASKRNPMEERMNDIEIYETSGVNGAEFTNYGAFVSMEQAEQMANTVGAGAILCTEDNGLHWVLADAGELKAREEFVRESEEVMENPIHNPQFFRVSYRGYPDKKFTSEWRRSHGISVSPTGHACDFSSAGEAQRAASLVHHRGDVNHVVHEMDSHGPFKLNPSLLSRISHGASELYKDAKRAITKRGTSKRAIQRLKEAERPAPLGTRRGDEKRNPRFNVGDWISWTSPKNLVVTGVVTAFRTGNTPLQDKVTFKSDGGQRGFRRGSPFTVDANTVRHSSRRNPSDTAEALYENFHGRAPGEILEITQEEHEHSTLTALGDLAQLKIITPFGKDCIINVVESKSPKQLPDPSQLPKSERVILASNEAGTQLYFVGGDQAVDVEALGFQDADVKDSMLLGVLYEVTYQTEKGFDNFELTNYYHRLGEDTGVEPVLLYDSISGLLKVSGGQYQVKSEGIVN